MIRRWRPEGVTPVEVWDWDVSGRPAWKAMDDPSGVVRAIARRLRTGPAATPVWVCGGVAESLRGAPDVVVPEEPRFAAHRGGQAIAQGGVVADLGQTSLKLSDASGRRVLVPRPAHLPPVTVESTAPADPMAAGDAAIRWVREALSRFGGGPRLVLALPCELDDDCVPGTSTYVGWAGRQQLAAALTTGLFEDVVVANDAEMAGAAARAEVGACLALTLGFAVGAALVEAP